MKISLKIFIFTYCIMMVVTIFGGFLLIDYEYQNSLKQAKATALEDNETLYIYVVATEETVGSRTAEYSLERFIEEMSKGEENTIFLGEYNEIKQYVSKEEVEKLQSGQYVYSIISKGNQTQIQVVSRYKTKYIINNSDITGIIERRNQNYELYRNIIIGISAIIAVVLYLFSWYITRPLTNVTKMAKQISAGDYSVRIDSSYKNMKSYEVEQLGNTLNHLAKNTESYIEELKAETQKKEDFMGNFTHEIKTPLTSIIGYADLLRTYDLESDKRREYSNYIYTEGKRVEQLAINLLQLIVMEKIEFPKRIIYMKEFFQQLEAEVRFLGEKYCVNIHFNCEQGTILGESSLLFVVIKNLIDNACKASTENGYIWIDGAVCGENYVIQVKDQGCGIPETEIQHILEPFYMVDKSRARKQGGAGLGLTLCNRIIQIHGGEMKMASELNKGTIVAVFLPCKEEGGSSDEESAEKE